MPIASQNDWQFCVDERTDAYIYNITISCLLLIRSHQLSLGDFGAFLGSLGLFGITQTHAKTACRTKKGPLRTSKHSFKSAVGFLSFRVGNLRQGWNFGHFLVLLVSRRLYSLSGKYSPNIPFPIEPEVPGTQSTRLRPQFHTESLIGKPMA